MVYTVSLLSSTIEILKKKLALKISKSHFKQITAKHLTLLECNITLKMSDSKAG